MIACGRLSDSGLSDGGGLIYSPRVGDEVAWGIGPGSGSATNYTDPGYMGKKIESLERINSIRETNENFDSCNSCKRLGTRLVIDPSGIDSESGIDSVLSGFRIGIDSAPPFSPWNRSRIQLL